MMLKSIPPTAIAPDVGGRAQMTYNSNINQARTVGTVMFETIEGWLFEVFFCFRY